jgi:hypothetical protein
MNCHRLMLQTDIVARLIGQWLQARLGLLAGTRGPSGEHLLSPVRHSNAVLKAFLRLAGPESSLATVSLHEVRTKLVEMLKNFDELIAQDRDHHGPIT